MVFNFVFKPMKVHPSWFYQIVFQNICGMIITNVSRYRDVPSKTRRTKLCLKSRAYPPLFRVVVSSNTAEQQPWVDHCWLRVRGQVVELPVVVGAAMYQR